MTQERGQLRRIFEIQFLFNGVHPFFPTLPVLPHFPSVDPLSLKRYSVAIFTYESVKYNLSHDYCISCLLNQKTSEATKNKNVH